MPYFHLSFCHTQKIIQHTVFLFNFTLFTRKKKKKGSSINGPKKFTLIWICHYFLSSDLIQYSSQIVETEAICLEFSPNFLHSLQTPSFSLKCAPLLPQCWATHILEHWDDSNTQINIGEGENHTSVSRFVTSIVGWFAICFVSKPWLFMN